MKRVIKFRGKRTDTSEWAYGSLLKFDIGYVITISETTESDDSLDENNSIVFSADEIAGVNPDTIGQFTGLLDKNGKEIYEGDIAKTNANEILGIIKWDERRLCFLCAWTNMCTAGDIEYLVNNTRLEVIGNIHDNSELLEGGKE